jgi:replication-associated recombination protein RarA
MEKELHVKIDAASVQLQNARRTGDVRDALNALELVLDAVRLLAAKPPH